MSKTSDVAARAAGPLTDAEIARAAEFAREPILINGERPEDLAPGTARRLAVEVALAEIEAGRETPSPEWRREYSLVLGLERLLAQEPPTLNDGAELDDHQVDALSGTLAALISEVEKAGVTASSNGMPDAPAEAELAVAEDEPVDDAPDNGELGENGDVLDADDEEPVDWEEEPEAGDEEQLEEAPEDPGASRRDPR